MYEFAIKRGGMSFNRILAQQTNTLKGGFGSFVDSRLKVKYRFKYFENGKVSKRELVDNLHLGFGLRI